MASSHTSGSQAGGSLSWMLILLNVSHTKKTLHKENGLANKPLIHQSRLSTRCPKVCDSLLNSWVQRIHCGHLLEEGKCNVRTLQDKVALGSADDRLAIGHYATGIRSVGLSHECAGPTLLAVLRLGHAQVTGCNVLLNHTMSIHTSDDTVSNKVTCIHTQNIVNVDHHTPSPRL